MKLCVKRRKYILPRVVLEEYTHQQTNPFLQQSESAVKSSSLSVYIHFFTWVALWFGLCERCDVIMSRLKGPVGCFLLALANPPCMLILAQLLRCDSAIVCWPDYGGHRQLFAGQQMYRRIFPHDLVTPSHTKEVQHQDRPLTLILNILNIGCNSKSITELCINICFTRGWSDTDTS